MEIRRIIVDFVFSEVTLTGDLSVEEFVKEKLLEVYEKHRIAVEVMEYHEYHESATFEDIKFHYHRMGRFIDKFNQIETELLNLCIQRVLLNSIGEIL